MKRKEFLRTAVTALTAAAAAGAPLLAHAQRRRSTAAAAGSLSTQEALDLKFMREEEKLAHDVYTALYAKWGSAVFANIAVSETDHTEAILGLLTTYGVADPAAGRAAGEFENPDLQVWYHALVALGQVSLAEALKVGALIEETDIRDIDEKMSNTTRTDILGVLSSLQCGSRNHLRAFHKQLVARGIVYQTQVISQEEWDAIASGSTERCPR